MTLIISPRRAMVKIHTGAKTKVELVQNVETGGGGTDTTDRITFAANADGECWQ